ncbi:hypothetical protein KJ567_04730, partial [Candidatus Bipolaricaulota bacterium]|nr:hypothetical protein [Candidatus Bipolaricaulota bacterium]
RNVVDGIDENTTDAQCKKILDARGRACVPQDLIEKAKAIYKKTKSVGPFLAEFNEVFKMLQIEDDAITVVYPRCFCHHIAGECPREVPDEYCECSIGWLKELFEQATGRRVEVKLLGSVVRGGQDCRFSIRFP